MGSGDAYGGIMSALGILLALYQRNRTGKGQSLDASLYGAQLFLAAPYLQSFLAGNPDPALQHSRKAVENPLWNVYPTADKWIYLCAENTDDAFARLCRAIGAAGLADDSRFKTADGRRTQNEALIAALDSHLKAKPHGEWLEGIQAEGLASSPINNLADVAKDEQAWQNAYFTKAYCEEVKREVDVRGLPVTLSKTPGEVATLGPQLGQDTEILMMDLLEYEWDEIEALKAKGAIP
jgi:crotonobetainyl-CoA:carnitine CoA-transferase CaiB-like acyl-CoA transferase